MFKIADSDQQKNAQIGSDPDPTDWIGTSLVDILRDCHLRDHF